MEKSVDVFEEPFHSYLCFSLPYSLQMEDLVFCIIKKLFFNIELEFLISLGTILGPTREANMLFLTLIYCGISMCTLIYILLSFGNKYSLGNLSRTSCFEAVLPKIWKVMKDSQFITI